MERNSRDFRRRIPIIDKSTEAICDFLRSRSAAGGYESPSIKDIFYPKWTARANYDLCRIKAADDTPTGGFGGLFSLTFTSLAASKAFFDALSIYKGPSLGTNFSLACPYAVLAHYVELGWAAKYGVEEGLVRVSVGMESKEELLDLFRIAVEAAEGIN
jgi:cystathionine gamma-synthase